MTSAWTGLVLAEMTATTSVLIACAGLLAACVLFWGIIRVWRKMLTRREREHGFEVQSLEEMHRRGMISDEEFSLLRRRVFHVDSPVRPRKAAQRQQTLGESGDGNPEGSLRSPSEDVDESKRADEGSSAD